MLVPNRHASSNSYRYGFQGQEKDDELKGEGNSYDFGARMLDPRVGRFFSVDPYSDSQSFQSCYVFSSNNPIGLIDLNGEIGVPPITYIDGKVIQIGGKKWLERYKLDYVLNANEGGGAWINSKAKSDMKATNFGAVLLLSFAIEEGGWGKGNDQKNTHNAFSLLSKNAKSKVGTSHGNVITYETWDEGFKAFKDLIDAKYPAFNELLTKDFVTADDINKALSSGNHHKQGGYTDSDKGKAIINNLKYSITFRVHDINNQIQNNLGEYKKLSANFDEIAKSNMDIDKKNESLNNIKRKKYKLNESTNNLKNERNELEKTYDKL